MWEYEVVTVRFLVPVDDKVCDQEIQAKLDELGEKGWELVSTEVLSSRFSERHRFYLKRRIGPEPPDQNLWDAVKARE